MNALLQLNTDFALPGLLSFRALPNGLCIADIQCAQGTASISLQGGHVLNWQPTNHAEPLMWVSRDVRFEPGKSIRGGVPVCWPWFGPHKSEASFPAHGFARTALWEVIATAQEGDAVRLDLRLAPQQGQAYWPHGTVLELSILVGVSLSMSLTTRNVGVAPVLIGEALHTYFKISDIANIAVTGLDGNEYWDTVGGVTKRSQEGAIQFTQETDRVYIDSPASCVIEDPVFKRRIHINKSGSFSTVVWSPWTDKATRMGDLGQPDGWREFVCVESANAWDNCYNLSAGEAHTLSVEYRVENMS